MVAEGAECRKVGRHGMIDKVAPNDLRQPTPPWSGIGWCIRRRSSFLISSSLARMRSRRDFRLSRNLPLRERPQMKMNPRNLKVSGFPSPRCTDAAHARPFEFAQLLSSLGVGGDFPSCCRLRRGACAAPMRVAISPGRIAGCRMPFVDKTAALQPPTPLWCDFCQGGAPRVHPFSYSAAGMPGSEHHSPARQRRPLSNLSTAVGYRR